MGSTPRGNLLSRVSHMGSFANWDSHAGPPTWAPSRVGSFPHMGSLTCDPSQMGSRTHMGSARVGTFPPGIPPMGSVSKGIPTGVLLTWDLILTWDLNGIIARELPHVGPSKHGILTLNPVYESRTQLLNSTQLNSTQLNSTPCARSTEGVIPPLVEASATRGTLSLVSQAAVGGTLG